MTLLGNWTSHNIQIFYYTFGSKFVFFQAVRMNDLSKYHCFSTNLTIVNKPSSFSFRADNPGLQVQRSVAAVGRALAPAAHPLAAPQPRRGGQDGGLRPPLKGCQID